MAELLQMRWEESQVRLGTVKTLFLVSIKHLQATPTPVFPGAREAPYDSSFLTLLCIKRTEGSLDGKALTYS
jgi:hypothetical protein